MSDATFAKDPASVIDYVFDWSDYLIGGAAITNTYWEISPVEEGGLTVLSPFADGDKRGTLVAGGLVGHAYRLTCRVGLSAPGVATHSVDRSVTIRVTER